MWGDWNAKVGKDACGNWQGICRPFCNDDTNERGLRLLDFASCNGLVLANTFGHHKASRSWTLHSPNEQHHNQVDYIRSEQCQNTKFSRSRHWKWSWLACDDLPLSPEKNQQAKTHKTQVWPWKAEGSQCVKLIKLSDQYGGILPVRGRGGWVDGVYWQLMVY